MLLFAGRRRLSSLEAAGRRLPPVRAPRYDRPRDGPQYPMAEGDGVPGGILLAASPPGQVRSRAHVISRRLLLQRGCQCNKERLSMELRWCAEADYCRLSLRERAFFRGAKDDNC